MYNQKSVGMKRVVILNLVPLFILAINSYQPGLQYSSIYVPVRYSETSLSQSRMYCQSQGWHFSILLFEARGQGRFLKGQQSWVFPNFLTQQLSVCGQGAIFFRCLIREPALIWNTAEG